MKRKNLIRILSLLLALLMLLSGCDLYQGGETGDYLEDSQNVSDGAISGRRTGILRQGIPGQSKTFEVTEDRVYFLVDTDLGTILYSMEHGAEMLMPLCTLNGCKHDGPGCEAFFGTGGNVCFYEGALFVNAGTRLYRMNPDGSNRMLILDVKEFAEEKELTFNGIAEAKLWNGVFSFYLVTFGRKNITPKQYETPEYTIEGPDFKYLFDYYLPYYYLLDGTMEQPQTMVEITKDGGEGSLIAQYNDGENFIMRGPGLEEKSEWDHLYTWDPQKNRYKWFADVTELYSEAYEPGIPVPDSQWWQYEINWNFLTRRYESYGEGYWGKKYAYYLEPVKEGTNVVTNKICRLDYATGKPKYLLDTGLEGSYKMACFPDCIVLTETMTNKAKIPEKPAVYIYDWSMELLVQGKLEYPMAVLPQDLICGESRDYLYLAANYTGVPEYYIKKSDWNEGNLTAYPIQYENYNPALSYEKWTEIYEAGWAFWEDQLVGFGEMVKDAVDQMDE